MAQFKTQLVSNKTWSEKRKYKVNSVVLKDGNSYQNITGRNSLPNLEIDWLKVEGNIITNITIEQLRASNKQKKDESFFIIDKGKEGVFSYDQNDVDSIDNLGTILVTANGRRYKRIYDDYADARWFGAKGDGVDLGIGDFNGDHEAINAALLACKKVSLSNGVFLCKRSIYLNSENDFIINEDARLKLGIASNCTFIKNRAVDFDKDGNGIATYPVDFIRDKNIKLHGRGIIDFNGWFQNRSDSPGGSIKDNPDVVGTPRFPDGDGVGSYYTGVGAKFADIDNLFIGGGLTVKNARTYTILIGGIHGYTIDDLESKRSYFVQNQDFFDINGDCFDGIINNVRGNSGDEFIVLATTSLGDETLRAGDIKRLHVSNISYYGINPFATPELQIEEARFEDNFTSHRLARISYTKDFVIDDILFENCSATNSKFHAQIVVSKLPYSGGVFPEVYDGNGYIGNLTFRNINSPNAEGLLDFGDYTIIKNLTIENIVDKRISWADPRCFIANYENFTGEIVDFTNSRIDSLTINDVHSIIGGGSNPSKPMIDFAGQITNLYVNNYAITTTIGSETDVFFTFIKSNVKNIFISKSRFVRFNKIFDLSNTDGILFENDCIYKIGKEIETQVFERINTNTLVLASINATTPQTGDSILTINGIEFYNVSLGSPTRKGELNIHNPNGFFGDTVPFINFFYNAIKTFRVYFDANANTVFEVIQFASEQSGLIFKINGINILNLKKDGTTVLGGTLKIKSYTVATLPAGEIGMIAYVTDALTPTFGTTLIGGGTVVAKAFYNGTNWINS